MLYNIKWQRVQREIVNVKSYSTMEMDQNHPHIFEIPVKQKAKTDSCVHAVKM